MERIRMDDSGGFSLLELMVASGIMALTLSMLFGSLLGIRVVGEVSEGRSLASTYAAGVLDEVRSLDLEELFTYQPPPFQGPGSQQAVLIELVGAGEEIIPIPLAEDAEEPTDLPNPVEVRVTVAWRSERGHLNSGMYATEVGR